ncbi:MAG: hypothetical protein P8N72_10940, partial [Flavimaricola sp.]|nr:hypothetical protein [Flavimaricola sp.]
HHLGFNDLKVIEVAQLIAAHSGGSRCGPDCREALTIQETIEAIQRSAISGIWEPGMSVAP